MYWLALVLLLLLVIAYLLWLQPLGIDQLGRPPRPAQSYAEALERIRELSHPEAGLLNPVCAAFVLDHGQRTEKAIAFLHGYTLCPAQFRLLAERFHQKGWNVYVPRTPHHGLEDRMSTDHGFLKPEMLVPYVNEVADILHGLGERTVLCGLSMGGVLATYAAATRPDLDLVMPMAPLLGVHMVPANLTRPVMNVIRRLPVSFQWWDPEKKEDASGADYAYHQFSPTTVAQLMRLGVWLLSRARQHPPAVKNLVFVTNELDRAVNNDRVFTLVERWGQHPGVHLHHHHFPASANLDHDIIDPHHPKANNDLVYPILGGLVEEWLP